MASGTIYLSGFKELSDMLLALGGALGGEVLKRATYKCSTVIRDEAIKRAPEDTGRLKQFIGRSSGKITTGDSRYAATVLVGLVRLSKSRSRKIKGLDLTEDAYYGKFVEFGTAYQAAQPFLRPAFDTQKEAFIEAMRVELWNLIEQAVVENGGKK